MDGFQSIMFFTLVLELGKIYDVELGEDWNQQLKPSLSNKNN